MRSSTKIWRTKARVENNEKKNDMNGGERMESHTENYRCSKRKVNNK